jgi:hypothetical protein
MHATVEEEAVADKEDTDDGENIFVQKKEGGVVNRNWVLLDSQSTVDQVSISNPAMLTNIHQKGKEPIKDTLQCRVYLQRA